MEDGACSPLAEQKAASTDGILLRQPNKLAPASLGKASLQVLVKAIVHDTSKTGYLHIRNTLQKQDYLGRAMTREEKDSIGQILEELEPRGSLARTSSIKKLDNGRGRGTARLSLSLSGTGTGAGARVSLSDMCRDPSLHSRLSVANSGVCA
jgi:hypothetical protein